MQSTQHLEQQEFTIQGISSAQLTEKFGSPLYVYDADIIRQKIAQLQEAFSQVNLKIKYACKANTNLSILRLMRENGVELDVVSPGELEMGILAGYAANQITFTPSGVPFFEVKEAIESGAIVNIDSLPLLEWFGQTYGNSMPCMIRIKPNVAAGGNVKIMTAHADSKFGISVLLLDDILKIVEKYAIKVIGLHQHTGSDIKDAEPFLLVADILLEAAKNFKDLEIIDLGGGFKVSYKPGDGITDMASLGNKISTRFQNFCKEYGRELQLWFEPGKFLVSESGFLLTTVTVVKQDPARNFVHIDSGLNHLVRPMMYGSYHHILNTSNPNGPEKIYNIVGYICETDTFATDRSIPEVSQNDILAFRNAGAYGFTMSSNYNARFKTAEVLVENGEAKLIRRRENMEDLLRTQENL